MDKDFNLQKICTSLILYLEKESAAGNVLRMSLDVQLPEHVNGDEYGLLDTITRISTFLTRHLSHGAVDIELLKIGQHKGYITVKVDVRGSDSQLLRKKKELLQMVAATAWLDQMRYKIVFSIQKDKLLFSFQLNLKTVNVHKPKLPRLFEHTKILLAEDNETNAMVFSSFLEEWGCSVTRVVNGSEALASFRDEVFDVVLMDIYMPNMNGNEAIRQIRIQNSRVPIIALTASSLDRDLSESLAAGANDFLSKPVTSLQLKKMLRKYV